MNLKERQEQMRKRWSRPRLRDLYVQEREKLDKAREQEEIAELAKRTDLRCPCCQQELSKINRRTGEILLCKYCRKMGVVAHKLARMFKEQRYSCYICPTVFCYTEKGAEPVVDKGHGRIRAILCNKCMMGLVGFGGSEELLESALNYIRFFNLKEKRKEQD